MKNKIKKEDMESAIIEFRWKIFVPWKALKFVLHEHKIAPSLFSFRVYQQELPSKLRYCN
jgi:hypothetical protein